MTQVVKDLVTWLKQWYYTESEVDTLLNGKQATLVSGTNIKTINNTSLLGSGNISVGGGGITIDDVYPIGSIYMSVNSTNPSTLFGGTWVQLKDTFLLACGDTYSNGSTGGSADAVVVSHTHDFTNGGQAITVASNSAIFTNGFGTGSHWNGSNANTGTVASSGESGTGKNMPPYLAVYVWKRVANVDRVQMSVLNTTISIYPSVNATLQASVYDENNNAISGIAVEFFKGTTSLGTSVTNSNGVASKTLNANGSGDITVSAECGGVTSSSVSIEDCYVNDATEHSRTQSGSTATSTTILSNVYWDNTSSWKATFQMKVSANSQRIDIVPPTESLNHHIGIGRNGSGSGAIYIGKASSGENYNTFSGFSTNTYYPIEITKSGTTVTFKFNGNTISHSYDTSWLSNYSSETIKYTQWASGTCYIKEIKVKKI